jgi:hypothetical protein
MNSKPSFFNRTDPTGRRRVFALAGILAVTLPLLTLMAAAPRASLSEHVLDIGIVRRGMVARRTVTLTNSGLRPLTVNTESKTCGIRAVTMGPITVAAGDTAALELEADTAIFPEGPSSREIGFPTNDPVHQLLTITVRLDVQSEAVAVPSVIRLGPGARTATVRLKVKNAESVDWRARPTSPWVSVELRPAAQDQGHQLELMASLRSDARESWDLGSIVISANGHDTPEVLRIPVRGPFPVNR